MELRVRPISEKDNGFINYWLQLSPDEIERLGVAVDRLPSADEMRSGLRANGKSASGTVATFVLAWVVDGEAIGHSSLKDIVPGESGRIHLHMWRPDLRGRGLGPRLFCLSALDFYGRFRLERIICEPKADNPAPNRMLQRIGFPLVESRIGASSDISTISRLNCYEIRREIAENFLRTNPVDEVTTSSK